MIHECLGCGHLHDCEEDTNPLDGNCRAGYPAIYQFHGHLRCEGNMLG